MRTVHLLALTSVLAASPAFAAEATTCRTDARPPKPVDKRLRAAAQKGLDYLVRESTAWTKQHKCYGCHVQAVTLEGLTIGRSHQYRVSSADIETMTGALLLGVTAGGRKTGAAFQGAAWAGYDQRIDSEQTDSLLKYARELLQYQTEEGAVLDDDRRPPVVAGTMQTTFQAMQTWRQSYARTADDIWLGPMRKAEGYLAKKARAWEPNDAISILDLNYALMGLVAAGVKRSEPTSQKLQRMLLARQNQDGSFGLTKERGDALATGQTLYALKLAGYSDRDREIARGMHYLISKQEKNGGWKTVQSAQNGADKGEAMWAVLGLVSVDVTSVSVAGLRDGQRIDGKVRVSAEAVDNQAGGIKMVELLVDDLPVHTECGSKISDEIDAKGLPKGRHYIDIVATNAAGKSSTRRLEVYTGDIFMTHVGARFDEVQQLTELSLRNIAESEAKAGKIRLEILTTGDKPKSVYKKDVQGKVGPMTMSWKGPKGRYTARLSFVDDQGKVREQRETVFFHDKADVQKATYGEVQGNIKLKKGNTAAGAVVELVDKDGRVVQRTWTTEQGNYRFKSVDEGDYKVRVRKRGFAEVESDIKAAPNAAPATADMEM